MRRYDDPVDVRRGMVPGSAGAVEGPAQFLWRGRVWKVRDVVGHWVETGPWWSSTGARALLEGQDPGGEGERTGPAGRADVGSADPGPQPGAGADLVAEREVWRVQAARGMTAHHGGAGAEVCGVFDLSFDWARGSWQLTLCVD